MSDGRPFVAGDSFLVADITGMAPLMACGLAGVELPDNLLNVKNWEATVKRRSS